MNNFEENSFQIIANIGSATDCYMKAMEEAKETNIKEARKLIQEGEEHYHSAHEVHSELIQKMANGENIELNLLLVHAEDQMMNSEIIKILALEIISLCDKIKKIEEKYDKMLK